MQNTFAFSEQVEKIETMKSGFFTGDPAIKIKRETITVRSSSTKDGWEEVITGYDDEGNEITVRYSCSHNDVWKGSLYATYKGNVQLEMHEEIAPSGTKGEEYLIKGNISSPLDTTKTVVIEGLYYPDGSKSRRKIDITLTLPAWDIVLTECITSSTEHSLIAEKIGKWKEKHHFEPILIAAGNDVFINKLCERYLEYKKRIENTKGEKTAHAWSSYTCNVLCNLFGLGLGGIGAFLVSAAYGAINTYVVSHM